MKSLIFLLNICLLILFTILIWTPTLFKNYRLKKLLIKEMKKLKKIKEERKKK